MASKSLEEVFDQAKSAIALGLQAIDAGRKTPTGAISAMFLARSAQALASCCSLCSSGHLADAMSVARTVVELDIEHAYIMSADDPVARFEQYATFDDVSVNKIMQAIGVLYGGKAAPEILQKWKQRATEAKQLAGGSRQWAGPNQNGKDIDLRDRAIATNRVHHYDLCYREGCGASHGGFGTLQYVLPEGLSVWPIKILVGPDKPNARAIELAPIDAGCEERPSRSLPRRSVRPLPRAASRRAAPAGAACPRAEGSSSALPWVAAADACGSMIRRPSRVAGRPRGSRRIRSPGATCHSPTRGSVSPGIRHGQARYARRRS
ncbi:MAG: hypothetical protein JWO36_624 [Myxococcales bacterium]|nr:hypothetical protein [Myxococcales bacterium]